MGTYVCEKCGAAVSKMQLHICAKPPAPTPDSILCDAKAFIAANGPGETTRLITARERTHGDFGANAQIIQSTTQLWRHHVGWSTLDTAQMYALEMIAVKIGRILCGKPDHKDSWNDIAGYATLVAQRCKSES